MVSVQFITTFVFSVGNHILLIRDSDDYPVCAGAFEKKKTQRHQSDE